MNHRKLQNFLKSMENSCDSYSESAEVQRNKLKEVDMKYKTLDRGVKKSLTITPQVHARPQTTFSATRPKRTMEKSKTPQKSSMNIRPAPYPVKNYILPAQDLVGPKRYFKSRARQQIMDDEADKFIEETKYPMTCRTPRHPESIDLIVVPSLTENSNLPPSRDSMDDFFGL